MKLIASLLTVVTQLAAQTPQPLPAPNGRLHVEFSDLSTIRELADGRVLLFDRKEERLVVGDFPSGSVYDVARKGQGPAEFEFIATFLALAGDTTIAADQTRRWLILVGDSVVRKVLPEHAALQRALQPLGADQNARILTQDFRGSRGAPAESTLAVLIHRVSGVADTIARMALDGRRGRVSTGPRPGGRAMSVQSIPLQAWETPLLFFDGWVAIARIEPYRVDWRAPDGRWTLGRPLPIRAARMTPAEKAAYIKRKPGFRNATDWPPELPPFENPVTLLASPDGRLVVRRLPTLAEPGTRYDVIDREGRRRTQLVLPVNERILGFGARSVYVVVTDDDGIQRLRRHPMYTSLRP
ncbi:MAG TPA: hypothetical protein VF128_05355 [Gemmatimonadaceae bacterium]